MKSTNWTLGKNKTGNTCHGNIFSYIKNYYIPTLKKRSTPKSTLMFGVAQLWNLLKEGGGRIIGFQYPRAPSKHFHSKVRNRGHREERRDQRKTKTQQDRY